MIYQPEGVAVDGSGNVFIADTINNRFRMVNASTGIITTVAGNGTDAFSGDNGLATAASLSGPTDVAVDTSGHLFIVDRGNYRIREVDLSSGLITTVAGNGTGAYGGDGGLATAASLSWPGAIAVDASRNLFITDGNRIRKITASTGIITTVAGQNGSGYGGDNGPATAAILNGPSGVAVDGSGNIFIANQYNERIRKVTASTGKITTVAGNGSATYNGDGILATAASIYPEGVAVDAAGNIFIDDQYNQRIRKVTASTGLISTLAGSGTAGYGGDGGAATAALLNGPLSIALDTTGNLFISDVVNNRIRKVNLSTNAITTIAGGLGDGGSALTASLKFPASVAANSSGNIFIDDYQNNRIREVNLATGVISGVAGNGTQGFAGDNGPPTAAALSFSHVCRRGQ